MATINSANSTSGGSTGSNGVFKTNSRITGKFSNLDTDSLVKNTPSGQQAKIDAVKPKQTKQNWSNDVVTDVKADINEFLNTYVSASVENSMLKSSDSEISDIEDRHAQLADRYYSKFSSMETALSKLNSQSSYINQLFQ